MLIPFKSSCTSVAKSKLNRSPRYNSNIVDRRIKQQRALPNPQTYICILSAHHNEWYLNSRILVMLC